jgi:DNA end-binding protein Ku
VAPRSIWSGAISFGLVNVPVKLYSATAKKNIKFHQLHDADGVRLQQKRVCPADNQEVDYDHVVKGFEVSRGRYIVVSPEELEAIDPKSTGAIEIEDFVDLSSIDPIYFEHSYYLAPENGAEKPYVLLLRAMSNLNKAAIAKVVIRQKQYLAALRPIGSVLSMVTLLFADEIVDPGKLEELSYADIEIDKKQMEMAERIIDAQSADFKAEEYRDEYRQSVIALIERKARGMEVVTQPKFEKKGAKVVDLTSALEASLAKATEKKSKGKRRQKKSA